MSKTTRLWIAILAVLLFFGMIAGVMYVSSISPEEKVNKDLVINEENFPNMWLRREVALQLDKDNNNSLSKEEIRQATSLSLPIGDRDTIILPNELNQLSNLKQLLIVLNGKGKKIDLHDLKYVEEIEVRNYAEGQSEVIFSKMTKLSSVKTMAKDEKYLVSFDIKDCPKLKEINVEKGEGLNGFAISDAPVLKEVKISSASVTSLDFHDLPELEYLELYYVDMLTTINVHNLQKLEKIYVVGNHVENLSLLALPKLKAIDISYTILENLDLSQCPNIKEILSYRNKKIKTLDLSNQRQLRSFTWHEGKLESIRWGKKDRLTSLDVNNNNLFGKWDLSKFPKLEELQFDNNSFEQVLGKDHKKIGFICCENNKLNLIDVEKAKEIHAIHARGNRNVAVYLPKEQGEDENIDRYGFDSTARVYYK